MTKDDLDEVTEIDREAFPTQWPPADYGYEFKNKMAHYQVACDSSTQIELSHTGHREGGLGWLGRLFGRNSVRNAVRNSTMAAEGEATRHYIVGFVGFWIMAGEAHITSIAVREQFRRRGIGELLLAAAVDMAGELGADVVTLEVRASNSAAQNLYTKYGFNRVGERKAYYLDRGPSGDSREDAVIMTTDQIRSNSFQARLRKLKEGLVTK
jgi:ribosomal-protein-alanine N-acetyltransferase